MDDEPGCSELEHQHPGRIRSGFGIRAGGSGAWQRIPVASGGRFRFRITELPDGLTNVRIHLINPTGEGAVKKFHVIRHRHSRASDYDPDALRPADG